VLAAIHAELRDINQQLADIRRALNIQETKIMSALQDLETNIEAKVAAETTVVGGVQTLLTSLKTSLDSALAALAAGGVSAADLARLQAISDKLGTNTDALSAAVVANTPAAPAAPPPAAPPAAPPATP
jgi:hypothetical protein